MGRIHSMQEIFSLSQLLHRLPPEIARLVYAFLRPVAYRDLMARKHATGTYTYQPFYDNQCIFVHIPKAAGVSVCKTFFGNLAGGHTDIGSYWLAFSRRDFKRYFKFTIVRNPWDRLFSAYCFLRAGGFAELDKEWAQKNISQYRDFNDFVIRWVSCKENIFSYYHFQPQYHFICHPVSHKIAVDFVGFYENLEADCAYIQRKIFGNADRTLLRTNTTKGKSKDYKEVYTDTTKEIVAHVYAKDIELLGYNFDNSSLPAQIANRPV